jgi:hypothetical protein
MRTEGEDAEWKKGWTSRFFQDRRTTRGVSLDDSFEILFFLKCMGMPEILGPLAEKRWMHPTWRVIFR